LVVGGIEVYFSCLDIIVWISILSFFNVNTPENLNNYFQYSSLGAIFSLPKFIDTTYFDDHPIEGPPRYH
jgi:hypothetical protein